MGQTRCGLQACGRPLVEPLAVQETALTSAEGDGGALGPSIDPTGLASALRALGTTRISAWNVEGLLLHRKHAVRAASKWRQLQHMAEHSEVIVVGLSVDVSCFHREFPQFVAWLSVGDPVGAGGMAILFRRSALQAVGPGGLTAGGRPLNRGPRPSRRGRHCCRQGVHQGLERTHTTAAPDTGSQT